MALSLAKAAPLKPEIKLAQALSEFEAVLADDQKQKLRTYRGQSAPNPTDVMRFTAEIDRDASRNRKSRQCVGTRFTNVLHSVQQFSTVVDFIVGGSQSQIAGAIWGTVKLSLKLASAISSYFDQLSTLFMKIGLTCPRYRDFGLLYPESMRLQNALCEYFVIIVRLCKQAVVFLKKRFWSQLSSSILSPFESEFGSFHQELEILANAIREEVSLASNQAQRNEATEMSRFRTFAKKFSDTSIRDLGEARTRKRKEAELRFLNACSVYNHEESWKQARKRGNTHWICHDEKYRQWKGERVSGTLWCTGILGSGKTVLSANVVEDLKITTTAIVAYFFCRYDEVESLQTRTIIGSIARQIFDHINPDIDAIAEPKFGTIDTDQALDYIQKLLPSNSQKYFIVIDGLDECEEKESRLLLQWLKQLLMSKHAFHVYCSSRPDIFSWAPALLEPRWNLSMSQTGPDIKEYIENTLEHRLESKEFSVGDPTIILTIRDTLIEKAHGMFLWVAFQIDSICSQKTDEAIRAALKDLPKNLPDTFNRILQRLQHSNAADPQFCRKIFDLLAAAQRPLTLEELREAVSIKPCETAWDASRQVNDILKTLLDPCGSLVAVDEEHLTVHFTHHSVKQHLLSKPTDSDMREFHVNMEEADLYLGDIIVTYLALSVFDRQLTKAKSTITPQLANYPSAILESLPRSSFANRVAVKLLKSRESFKVDIHSQLKTAAGIVGESNDFTEGSHPFLSYAQEYWHIHTKAFRPTRAQGYTLWNRLIDGEVKTIELPWAPKKWHAFGDEYMKWIIQNEHWALIYRTLFKFATSPIDYKAAEPILIFLEKRAIEDQSIDVDLVSFMASYLQNERIRGIRGFGLHEASRSGNKKVVRFLLENWAETPADIDTALVKASAEGHGEIARLLLGGGANVNAESGFDGTALQAASESGREEIVGLFLKNGANVNTESGHYGTALQAASANGHEEIVGLLLKNGANVNAESGYYGTALQAASTSSITTLLLQNGANLTILR